ncbi:MAG: hypothetical protein ABMA13_16620 [Chthoniobacteraceae bacterium]
MKLLVLALLAVTASAFAGQKVTLSGVHNCCKSCTKGIEKAVATVPGVTTAADKETITLTAGTAADLQKAVDALFAAGFTGVSDNAAVKVAAVVAPDAEVTTLTISGAHLCCGKCVTAAEKAILGVSGVTGHTAEKNSETFKVEGKFNAKAVMASLAKAGFSAKASK